MNGPSAIQFERFVRIDQDIRSGHLPSRGKWAREFGVTTRTIQRDLDFMRDRLGAPIEWHRDGEHGRTGYRYSANSWALKPVLMNEGDLFALLVARQALSLHVGSPVAGQLEGLFERVALMEPGKVSLSVSSVQDLVSFEMLPARPVAQRTWDIVCRALRECLAIEFSRRVDGVLKEIALNPHHLANLRGEWCLLAWDKGSRKIQPYALAAIRNPKLTDRKFLRDPSFVPKQWLDRFFGRDGASPDAVRCRIRFSRAVAGKIKGRIWHPDQRTTRMLDGSIVLEMPVTKVGPAKSYYIQPWIMSFGSEARVLAPLDLAEAVALEAGRAAQQYASSRQAPGSVDGRMPRAVSRLAATAGKRDGRLYHADIRKDTATLTMEELDAVVLALHSMGIAILDGPLAT